MSSYKTFLNGVRAAISSAFNKVSQRLARFEETATQKYNELAYVPIYETPIEDVWSGELTEVLVAIESGFPELVIGKEYIVTIGDVQYKSTATLTDIGDASGALHPAIGNYGKPEDELYIVITSNGAGIISVSNAQLGKTMKIQTAGDPVEVGKEWLPDYAVNAQTTAETAQTTAETAQTTAETAQTTAETAQTTAETAQTTAETAQTTAETAQTTAETAQTTAETAKTTAETAQTTAETAQTRIAMGFGTEIPSYRNNRQIEYALFPNALKVDRDVFSNCRNLKEVYLPSVTRIDTYAFEGCGLTGIVIPASAESIGLGIFAYCNSLTSIIVAEENKCYSGSGNCLVSKPDFLIAGCGTSVIPANVTVIAIGAFTGCRSLTSIAIPEGVTRIFDGAFLNCENLTTITYAGTMEQWNAITKDDGWNQGVPATEVVCSDGSVPLTTET